MPSFDGDFKGQSKITDGKDPPTQGRARHEGPTLTSRSGLCCGMSLQEGHRSLPSSSVGGSKRKPEAWGLRTGLDPGLGRIQVRQGLAVLMAKPAEGCTGDSSSASAVKLRLQLHFPGPVSGGPSKSASPELS